MKWRRYRQRQRPLRALGFGDHASALDRRFVACNHHLRRRIEIDCFDHFALRGFRTCRPDGVVIQPEDCRHASDSHRHRFLHGFCAKAHQRHCIGKSQRAGRHQRRVFAQTMACHHRRPRPARLHPSLIHGIGRRQHHRLRVDGRIDRVDRSLGYQLPKILAENA